MRVPWLKLVSTQGQKLTFLANHIGMIGEYYERVENKTLKEGHEVVIDTGKCNIMCQGQYISVKGSPELIQTLVTKALTEETVIGSAN